MAGTLVSDVSVFGIRQPFPYGRYPLAGDSFLADVLDRERLASKSREDPASSTRGSLRGDTRRHLAGGVVARDDVLDPSHGEQAHRPVGVPAYVHQEVRHEQPPY